MVDGIVFVIDMQDTRLFRAVCSTVRDVSIRSLYPMHLIFAGSGRVLGVLFTQSHFGDN